MQRRRRDMSGLSATRRRPGQERGRDGSSARQMRWRRVMFRQNHDACHSIERPGQGPSRSRKTRVTSTSRSAGCLRRLEDCCISQKAAVRSPFRPGLVANIRPSIEGAGGRKGRKQAVMRGATAKVVSRPTHRVPSRTASAASYADGPAASQNRRTRPHQLSTAVPLTSTDCVRRRTPRFGPRCPASEPPGG